MQHLEVVMGTQVKVLVIDHSDITIEGLAQNKEEMINSELLSLEQQGMTILQLMETVSATSYSVPGESGSYHDYHYNDRATVVTILFTDRKYR